MAHANPFLVVIAENQPIDSRLASAHCVRVQPEYVSIVNSRRKFVDVSPSFCKLLGYTREELIGQSYDEFTAPRTNHIPITWRIFLATGYLFGIWVFVHRSGTKLFVRYEAFARADGLCESHMELLGAGA